MDHIFSDWNNSKLCKFRSNATSHSFFNYVLLIFQKVTVQWLNCTYLKYEQNIIEKRMTSSEPTKFAQFWVVSVRKCMVKKYLIYDSFSFLDRVFSRNFFIIPYELFLYYLVNKESVILRSLSCFNPYFILLKYKHKHCK